MRKQYTKSCRVCGVGFTTTEKHQPTCGRRCGHTKPREKIMGYFWSLVGKGAPTACWLWNGCRDSNGYGRFRIGGKSRLSHRMVWEETNGKIPDGLFACHKCDVPACVNPYHIFLGTQVDNMADMAAKGRAAIRAGEDCNKARLKEHQVLEIRRRFAAGETNQARLGREFGVQRAAIRKIVRRMTWPYLASQE